MTLTHEQRAVIGRISLEDLARYAIERGAFWCQNCDGAGGCMDCRLRYRHDECEQDCPDCRLPPDGNYKVRPSFGSVLPQGWAREEEGPR